MDITTRETLAGLGALAILLIKELNAIGETTGAGDHPVTGDVEHYVGNAFELLNTKEEVGYGQYV